MIQFEDDPDQTLSWVSLVKTSAGIFLLWEDDHVLGFETKQKALDYYEGAYSRGHSRSYEGSMSACVNFMEFQASIVAISEAGDLFAIVEHDEDGKVYPHTLRSVSGGMAGLKCTADAEQFWEKGTRPSLMPGTF
jgi:hypothetical protein